MGLPQSLCSVDKLLKNKIDGLSAAQGLDPLSSLTVVERAGHTVETWLSRDCWTRRRVCDVYFEQT